MDNMVLFLGMGLLIGIILFFVCERMGWLHKWSGLEVPQSKLNKIERDNNAP